MAVHKGRKNTLSPLRGTVIPTNRVLGPISKAIIFELPEATSGIQTIARPVDVSTVTIRSVVVGADLRAVVIGSLNATLDVRILAVRPVFVTGGLQMTIYHVLDMRPDISEAIFGPVERLSDCAQVVLHRLMSDADIKQSIYVYLFRESHEIQV